MVFVDIKKKSITELKIKKKIKKKFQIRYMLI